MHSNAKTFGLCLTLLIGATGCPKPQDVAPGYFSGENPNSSSPASGSNAQGAFRKAGQDGRKSNDGVTRFNPPTCYYPDVASDQARTKVAECVSTTLVGGEGHHGAAAATHGGGEHGAEGQPSAH